jgi:hypothetical protein
MKSESELKQYIVIGITNEGNAAIKVTPDTDAATAFQLLGTLTGYLLNTYRDIAVHSIDSSRISNSDDVPVVVQGITESMYDAVNNMFSNILNEFYPENPALSLEDEAILELVNQKIEAKYNSLSEEDKQAYRDTYNKMKAELEKNNHNQEQTSKKED